MKQSDNKKSKKSIHFIGIGGKAMASIAKAFRDKGWQVTGSEKGEVYPPMSTYLEKNKIKYYSGFDPDKVGSPDEVVIGNAYYADDQPELVYTKQNKISYQHFPKLLEKYLIKKNSIVVAGTFGKTTISAMATWVFKKAGEDPAYLTASVPINFPDGCSLGGPKTNWSIVEGDEYPSASPWDFSPKFDYYHPKYLILTSAEWDHLEIFKTQQSYINAFIKLVKQVPKNGIIVANANGKNMDEVLKHAKCKVILYSTNQQNNPPSLGLRRTSKTKKQKSKTVYHITTIQPKDKNKTEFIVYKNNKEVDTFRTSLIGDFNLENWLAVIALSRELKILLPVLQKSVASFKGVRKRLEILALINEVTIIDDFAHSPSKAKGAMQALKKYFPHNRLWVLFAPNQGNRIKDIFKEYDYIFQDAYSVFIPALDQYSPKPGITVVDGQQLADYFQKTHKNVHHQPSDNKILTTLVKNLKPGDIVAFLSHANFHGLPQKLIEKLKNKI